MSRVTKTLVGAAPHIHAKQSTASLAWGSSLLLVPAFLWGLYCFKLAAVLPVVAAISAAILGELLIGLARKAFTLGDGTAFLTGLLVGLSMPPGVPLQVPILSALFAICLIKGAFGGLGANWMNPALAGVVFALLNWPAEMGTWKWPSHLTGVVGVSGASPLGFVHSKFATEAGGGDALSLLGASGFSFSGLDRSITAFLNNDLLGHLGVSLPSGYMDILIGNKAGAIGELSGLLLLAASIVLIARRIIRWEIPASIFASFAVLVWIFGGIPFGNGYFSGDILFEVLSGSFILVSFFMATDPVTSPSTPGGRILYGLAIGGLTFIIRRFGSGAEGVAFAVVIMNCFVPAIGKLELAGRINRTETLHE